MLLYLAVTYNFATQYKVQVIRFAWSCRHDVLIDDSL